MTPHGRRIIKKRIEGVDITGVVLRESALDGYADWRSDGKTMVEDRDPTWSGRSPL